MIARLYRLALRAFARRHRDLYAAEMIDAFERELDSRRRSGSIAMWTFAIAACANAIVMGVVDRRRRREVRLGRAFSSLDFTLAWRMLLRYPGLSAVSIFGMAVGIAIAAGAATIVFLMIDVRMPLPQSDRIVSLIALDARQSNRETRLIHEFPWWRGLQSMEAVGIARQSSRNLIIDGHQPEAVRAIEISASAFQIAGVPAWRGRYLLTEDASASAPNPLVIGYNEWLRRFDADQEIVGRGVQLGGERYTIVGVMPDGFGFPEDAGFWIPWRITDALYPARTGPSSTIFGKLKPGVTLQQAQAELDAHASNVARESAAEYAQLHPRVVPYVYAYTDMGDPGNMLAMRLIQIAVVMLLMIVCVNVAILVYARTATRQGEIAVRGALGASRTRIVAQLFVEALAMATASALIGLGLLALALPQMKAAFLNVTEGRLPFWMDFGLRTDTVVYTVGLTLLSAAIVGVLPALKATGKNVYGGLQTLSPGSGSRMQMGRMWTLLIVGQVAVTVALLPATMFFTWDGLRLRSGNAGFASREFLNLTLAMDQSPTPGPGGDATFRTRYAAAQAELDRQLRADPAVTDVTYSLIDAGQEWAMALEAEGRQVPDEPVHYTIAEGTNSGHLVRYNRVAPNFFDAFEVPILVGRPFTSADFGTNRVVINRKFAETVFGNENPLGRHVKYVGRSREAFVDDDFGDRVDTMPTGVALEQWFEIVGVVPNFPADEVEAKERIYHPAAMGEFFPARIAVRVRSTDPLTFAGKLRGIAAAVSPSLAPRDITTTELIVKRQQGIFTIVGLTVGGAMLSVIVLSAAGIYALMSFTVARRRREIGIRAALGANRNRLLLGIFSRAVAQLGVGALLGAAGAVGIDRILEGGMMSTSQRLALVPIVAIVMATVGVLASIGPARQGLSIQPIEALRDE